MASCPGVDKYKESTSLPGFWVWGPDSHWDDTMVSALRLTKKTQPKLSLLVVWGGIEPPTQGFSVLCSTN